MAYKKGKGKLSRRPKKMEPAVQTLLFTTPVTSAGTTANYTIDLSQCASLVNRRFYRQGINWAVGGIRAIYLLAEGQTSAGSVIVNKLPQTWVMSNAWEKGFRTWQKMNDEALAEAESIRPRFLDYKIYADNIHHTDGFSANLLPINGIGAAFAPGEWESSKMVIPKTDGTDDTNSREIIATGASYPGASPATTLNAVSLIEGYAASRGLPNIEDPNAPADSQDASGTAPQNWMVATFNEGTEQDGVVLTDMVTENNIAPYPFENDGINLDTMYPNGANQAAGLQVHDYRPYSATTLGGQVNFKGGMFPSGS
jgi:hypothetical protein